MIEAIGLSKRYGGTTAVEGLTFTVPAGQVTGFLGPNGAGKSTTMRMVLGLDAPSAGFVTVNGRPYASYRRPLLEVGALLDASAIHPGRTAQDHLRSLAASNGIPLGRVHTVLDQVGLRSVARRRVGGFSLGMRQRLGIAGALLGDPGVLMFDEPVSGLDPEGVLWIRTLLRTLAAEGRTVFLSSHLMSEMALTADRLIIIGRGRLITESTMTDLLAGSTEPTVRVRTPDAGILSDALRRRGATVTPDGESTLTVTGVSSTEIGAVARTCGATLQELSEHRSSLEERYMQLTEDSMEYTADEPHAQPTRGESS